MTNKEAEEKITKRLDRHARAINELRKEVRVMISLQRRFGSMLEGISHQCKLCTQGGGEDDGTELG